ncbi:MAG: hypothetical protein JNL74_17400 [Fibrobacteres bacterium]|nr:hypothetical protein [Fibrobacterota bacterium]
MFPLFCFILLWQAIWPDMVHTAPQQTKPIQPYIWYSVTGGWTLETYEKETYLHFFQDSLTSSLPFELLSTKKIGLPIGLTFDFRIGEKSLDYDLGFLLRSSSNTTVVLISGSSTIKSIRIIKHGINVANILSDEVVPLARSFQVDTGWNKVNFTIDKMRGRININNEHVHDFVMPENKGAEFFGLAANHGELTVRKIETISGQTRTAINLANSKIIRFPLQANQSPAENGKKLFSP